MIYVNYSCLFFIWNYIVFITIIYPCTYFFQATWCKHAGTRTLYTLAFYTLTNLLPRMAQYLLSYLIQLQLRSIGKYKYIGTIERSDVEYFSKKWLVRIGKKIFFSISNHVNLLIISTEEYFHPLYCTYTIEG